MKLVVLTGASKGIGLATSNLLVESGIRVLGVSRYLPRTDFKFDHLQGDITDRATAKLILERAKQLDGVTEPVLVNCAGAVKFGDYHDFDWEHTERELEINFTAPAQLIHTFLPWMLDCRRGHVINILSIAARHAFPSTAAYGGAKAGLQMMTRCLAERYRKDGIRFSSISPGATDTDIWNGQGFEPNRGDMLPVSAVAECIRDVILSPQDRSFDDILIMPPKGIV